MTFDYLANKDFQRVFHNVQSLSFLVLYDYSI
jgi:hypothetical protein